jgi:hypothetical protein
VNEGPNDPFNGQVHGLAISLHEMYQSFMEAGFTDDQAMAMVNQSLQTLLTISMMGGTSD